MNKFQIESGGMKGTCEKEGEFGTNLGKVIRDDLSIERRFTVPQRKKKSYSSPG